MYDYQTIFIQEASRYLEWNGQQLLVMMKKLFMTSTCIVKTQTKGIPPTHVYHLFIIPARPVPQYQ